MSNLEKFTRKYDKALTCTIVVCMAMIFSMLITSYVVSLPVLEFDEKWTITKLAADVANFEGYAPRLVRRSKAMMEQHCNDNSATFAPQVRIDGKPWNVPHVYMCNMGLHLTAPQAVVVGQNAIQCEEEHEGMYKIVTRHYPLTITANEGQKYTITHALDACTIWHAMSLIAGIW